jgi:hypothetical protein
VLVVGGGFAGFHALRGVLVDISPAILPELGPKLGAAAMNVLQSRGVEVRLGVTVASADAMSVQLTDGTDVPSRTLVWGAGVVASPLAAQVSALRCSANRSITGERPACHETYVGIANGGSNGKERTSVARVARVAGVPKPTTFPAAISSRIGR